MDDSDLPTDSFLEKQQGMGEARLELMKESMLSHIPAPRIPMSISRDILEQQEMHLKENLKAHYLELLVRAARTLEFMDNNIGHTDDWPVMLVSESEEVEKEFDDLKKSLDYIVGALTEF